MPATKITELTAISTVNTTVDPLAIVDVSDTTQASSGTTKKITVSQIDAAIFGSSGSKAIVVDNVAALKALTVSGITDGQLYITRGYYSDNDGGQGTYIYDTASAAADNGGTVIAPTAGSGRFLLQYSGPVNVKQFGAKGDSTTNDTAAIQNAINASLSVFIPSGSYNIQGTATYGLLLREGSEIFGSGIDSTVLIKSQANGASFGCLHADSGSSSVKLKGIIIHDIQIDGKVATLGFSEFQHLISLNGVVDAKIYNTKLIGFRGDGVYIGSGTTAGHERHNTNVVITNCVFDGVNKDNRNGVSVIDCDGFLVSDCYFKSCTKSTMPGAVDIEPDSFTFHIIKDIKVVNNKFYDIGGNVGAISVYFPTSSFTTAPSGFLIEGNNINTCAGNGIFYSQIISGGVAESTTDACLKISNNTVTSSYRPFSLFNCKESLIVGNSFLGSTNQALLSYNTANDNLLDCKLISNSFTLCGSSGGIGLEIFKCSRLLIENNTFNDCGAGTPGSANAIDFNTGTSSYVTFNGNVFVSPTGKTQVAIQKEAAHTFTASTNQFFENVLSGLTNAFSSEYNDIVETSYTPVVTGSSTAGSGTYTVQYGRWHRIGKRVFFRIKVSVNSGHTGSGMIQVGLPTLAVAAPNNEETTCTIAVTGVSTVGGQVGLINPALVVSSLGAIRCYHTDTGTLAQTLIPAGAFTVYASGSYFSA
jgi:hypothetical protein